MDKTLKIALLLTAVDHMSEKVDRAVEHAQGKFRGINKFSRGLNSAGSLMITAGTAGVEFFDKNIEAAEQFEKAQKRVEATFKHQFSNYHEATDLVEKYAEKASKQIGIEQETIAAVEAKLGIFKRVANQANLTNGIFNRATMAAFDMQAVGHR
jgi:hypothetical protein